MSGPYKKEPYGGQVIDDAGWALLDSEGCTIAILETEGLADALLSVLDGVEVVLNLQGGIVQDALSNVRGISVVVVDWEVIEEEEDHTYATRPDDGEELHAWCYEISTMWTGAKRSTPTDIEIMQDVFFRTTDSPYYRPKPGTPVDTSAKYASTCWTVDDVLTKAQEMGLDLTPQEAETFLINSQRQIVDDMVARGWDSIETLLSMREQE